MAQERSFPVFSVTVKGEKSIRRGHPWVFADEIVKTEGAWQNGDLVDVRSQKGQYLGTGFVNEQSKIRVRIISGNANDKFDEAFFARRVKYAIDYRRTVMGEDFSACRLIFGEADQFPGLTVDKFGDILVTQTLSLGIEQRKETIFSALVEELSALGEPVRAIYERNDVPIREKEGMEQYTGFFPLPGLETDLSGHTTIKENGIEYDVDYIRGQKTGFFLDQKYNRQAVARLCRGKNVLDCFTHTGAFALNAYLGGASHVTAVDISALALEQAKENAARNGIYDIDWVQEDVFEFLDRKSAQKRGEYDLIILDPPAFTKSSATAKSAYRGYKQINLQAMRMLPRGGYLATCSCSHFMKDDMFCEMVAEAARDAGVSLRRIEGRRQSPDHPILMAVPETDYLKFYLFQVV